MRTITINQQTKEDFLKAVIAEVAEQINIARGIPEVHINKKLTADKTKPETNAIINFSAMAWLKMRTQINNSKDECAWHGIVEPNEERTVFNVTDILVYPQRINGMTVEDDDPLYEVRHQRLDTYTYNHLRMQGHSHVNAAASPSSRDDTTYANVVQALSNDSFYIFMIANKQGNMWFNIYDLQNNRIWEQVDIDVTVDGEDLYAWFKEMSDTYYAKRTTVLGGSKTADVKSSSSVAKTDTFLGKTIPTLDELKEKRQKIATEQINYHNVLFRDENIDAFFSAGDGPSDRQLYGGLHIQ